MNDGLFFYLQLVVFHNGVTHYVQLQCMNIYCVVCTVQCFSLISIFHFQLYIFLSSKLPSCLLTFNPAELDLLSVNTNPIPVQPHSSSHDALTAFPTADVTSWSGGRSATPNEDGGLDLHWCLCFVPH